MKRFTEYFAALLLMMMPLKFGGLAVMPETGGFYPENFADWFFIVNWPPHSIAFFGTALLIITAFGYREKLNNRILLFLLIWCILPALAAVPGMIRGERLIALGELSLLLGCGSVIAAITLLVGRAPEKAAFYAGALLIGTLFTAIYGWYQHLVVLDEMRQFAAEQEAAGIAVSDGLKLKLSDQRIYATLSSSNVLASLLMLMIPVGLFCAEKWSKYINPPRSGKIFFSIFFTGLMLSVLLLTRSRSMIFCPVGAAMIALFSHSGINKRWKIAGLSAGILLATAGIIFISSQKGRSLASMGERVDYWRTCAVLCKDYPLAGGGWGEFFHTHMLIKVSDIAESARDPHNVVASFASQCGIPAALIILTVLLWPLIQLWPYRFSKTLPGIVFWSGVLFTLHSLIDCDWQVPAMITVMGVLYAAAIAQLPDTGHQKIPVWLPLSILGIAGVTGSAISYHYLAGDKALSRLQDKVNPATRETEISLAHFTVDELAAAAAAYRPRSAVIYMYAGDWYLQRKNLVQAEKNYRKALELDPRRPGAYSRLASIELLRGNRHQAEKYQSAALALFPKSTQYTLEKLYGEP
ncbi:MAG: O-antigen ligase family protein [Lentisphaeria bacterium]|nr:O-antigen ligase family protein [Lentisphaeria bacterium]